MRLILGLLALTAIAVLTLWPGSSEVSRGFSWCVACGEFGTLDVLLNIALFIPFGAALTWGRPFARGRAARAIIVAFGVATIVELLQLTLIRGRDPSLSDIVANSLGGLLGASLAHEGTWSVRTWRRLSWVFATTASALLVLGQWGLQPLVPYATYYAQWRPQRPAYVPFTGELREFFLDTIPLPPGAVIRPQTLPDEFFQGQIVLRARVIPGSQPRSIALIARLAFIPGELVMLGRAENSLVFRYRAKAVRAGFRSPLFALPHAFDVQPESRLLIGGEVRPGAATLRATNGRPFSAERHFSITAARSWALLLPWNYAVGDSGEWIDAAWLALLVGLVAYAAARARRPLYAAWPLQLLALVLICLTSLAPSAPRWPVWLAAIAAAALGLWLGARRTSTMAGAT